MTNGFGISEKSYDLLLKVFAGYTQIEQVIIFGSRAKGNYKQGSDIDLAIKGKDCNEKLALEMKGRLNEGLPIPYHVDVVDYESVVQKELKEHIDRVGKIFYEK